MKDEIEKELNALDESAQGEEPPQEVKQALDTKGASKANKAKQEWAELFEGLINPVSTIVVPGWHLQGDEIKALSSAYADLAHKYYPEGVTAAPEIMAAAVTGAVILPRVAAKMPRKMEQEKPENLEENPYKGNQGENEKVA